MSKEIRVKELVNSKILKEYASWIYCSACERTVAYLCYTGYNEFDFEYKCQCGSKGSVHLHVNKQKESIVSHEPLAIHNKRYCCVVDDTKLFSLVDDRH